MEEGQPLKGTAPQREEERVWPALAGWLLALALLGALLYVTLTNMPAHHLASQLQPLSRRRLIGVQHSIEMRAMLLHWSSVS